MSVFHPIPRIVSSAKAIEQLGHEIKRLGAKRALLVTDPGLMQTGIVQRACDLLDGDGIEVTVFSDVLADPPYEIVADAVNKAVEAKADCILGVGGGSSLDVAKMVSVLMTNDTPIEEMFGIDLVPKPGMSLILVPTTAGTGSEVTPIAILSDEKEKLKKGVVSPYLLPTIAILDPDLTIGLPSAVTMATGLDALIHAVEAFTSKNATPWSDMFAREAIRRISANIRSAYADGGNIEARSIMLEASLQAGVAFANAGVTAVHAFAYPIGAEFHIPHGIANTIMLIPVMEYNVIGNLDRFAELAELLGENTCGCTKREAAQKALDALNSIADDVEAPRNLDAYGVKEKDIPMLAEGVMKVTRLLGNNPRVMTVKAAEEIYRKAL